MKQLLNWTEIPAADLPRAKKFYSSVFDVGFVDFPMPGMEYALFSVGGKADAGALVKGVGYVPSQNGVVLYLDAGPDMAPLLERIKVAGGQVVLDKTFLSPEAGHIGLFIDSEGNKIGLQHP